MPEGDAEAEAAGVRAEALAEATSGATLADGSALARPAAERGWEQLESANSAASAEANRERGVCGVRTNRIAMMKLERREYKPNSAVG